MAKGNVEKMILDRFDRLEAKLDRLTIEVVPKIKEDFAVYKAAARAEASAEAKFHGRLWGGLALAVSAVSALAAWVK